MKMLFLVLAIVVGLLLAHNYVQTGQIGFNSSMTETEREIKHLEDRLGDAIRAYRVAGRGAAVGAVDGTSEAESALGDVRFVERDLDRVRQLVNTDSERQRLKALEERLKAAKQDMGIR